MNYSVIIDSSLLRNTPELVAWGIGIVLAVLMVRRGGGKAEKLLLAGCSLMFAVQLISSFLSSMVPWLREQGISAPQLSLAFSLAGIPSLAGFVCLVYAFWVRFRARRQESA